MVRPLRLFQDESQDKIREWGIAEITPGRHQAEWKQPSQEGHLRCVALADCTDHEAHLAAAAAIAAHDAVQRVTALVHVQGGSKAAPTVAALLQTLRRTRASRAVPGTALQGVVRTERQPWETADPAVVDPAPPGHILQLVWERLPEDNDRESAELLDVDPAPLDPVPATVRVVCVLDPAVLADADVRRLHVGAFGKDHAWRHLRPLMGAALLHPSPMQATVRGSMVEVSTDLPSSVAPLVMRASGNARGVHLRPWIVTGAACQDPAYVLWFKQPPERRGPSPEVWKTLAEDGELRSMFAGLVDGGAPGNVGVRVWGAKPADPKVVAHIANLLGAPARRRPRPCLSGATPRNWAWRWTSMRSSGATPRRRLGRRRPSASTAAPGWPTAPLTARSSTWSWRECLRTGKGYGWVRPTPASPTGPGSGPRAAPVRDATSLWDPGPG